MKLVYNGCINHTEGLDLDANNGLYVGDGINMFDGFRAEPIWTLPDNYSTYCSDEIDDQCSIPGLDLEEILKELGRI